MTRGQIAAKPRKPKAWELRLPRTPAKKPFEEFAATSPNLLSWSPGQDARVVSIQDMSLCPRVAPTCIVAGRLVADSVLDASFVTSRVHQDFGDPDGQNSALPTARQCTFKEFTFLEVRSRNADQ